MIKKISNIVFTRNRPLQLEAYLQSSVRHLPEEVIQTYILYKQDLFDEEYIELFRRMPHCVVIREENFHVDFTNLIMGIETPYVLFGTDDVVYYDSVPFPLVDTIFSRYPEEIFGFSFRLSPLTAAESADVFREVDIGGEKVYRLDWKEGRSSISRYPFELNSTVYRTSLVQEIVSRVTKERPYLARWFGKDSAFARTLRPLTSMKDFHRWIETFCNPNTLESDCYRWCKKHKAMLPGRLFFQKLCASAIQVNTVNATTHNPIARTEEHTVEILNEKYREGFRVDLDAIVENKPKVTHVGPEYFRLVKYERVNC